MMRRDVFSLALGWALPLAAQEPVTIRNMSLSEGDRLLIETTQLLGIVSGSTDKFTVVQQYITKRDEVTAYLEKQYPGQTVDWSVIPAVLKAK